VVTFGAIAVIVAGVVIIIAAGAVISVVNRVKSAIDPFVEIANSINVDEQELEFETSPKSVNAMTSVYLPRIEKDFPEFNYFEFKAKAENMMKSSFNAISTEDIACLTNASRDLTIQIKNTIEENRANHRQESFSDIEIHRTEIKNYRKDAGSCIITLQSSVGYIHFVTDGSGAVIEGSMDRKFQTRYDIDLMYIQDVEKIENGQTFVSNNCPNCGAPIKSLGEKTCPYCGSSIVGVNVRTWQINKLIEC